MAKRTYRKISSYLSFRYFSRVNNEKWKEEYKQRTGRDTARGWQHSEEYAKYKASQQGRIKTFAERNPERFFEKKDYILRRSDLTASAAYTYSDSPTPGAQLLNPMKGGDDFGPSRLMEGAENRAQRLGKELTVVTRVNSDKLLGGSRVATNENELQQIRGDMLKEYGQAVAKGKGKGTYGLIGSNYSIQYFETGGSLLAVIDVDLFLY